MKFYKDQHKLAAYLERTGAEWEFENAIRKGKWHVGKERSARALVKAGFTIRPVLRYNLPSHLLSDIANPDNLTEEQICEGGKYRACVKDEFLREGAEFYDLFAKRWSVHVTAKRVRDSSVTYRLPADVPWHDWELTKATPWPEWPDPENEKPDPKDARIAELENEITGWRNKWECAVEMAAQAEAKLASPWRRMSEVPTEDDRDRHGYVFGLHARHGICVLLATGLGLANWPGQDKDVLAWMPAPKFHGWPDPLADLLKSHGIEATQELTAALTAWKGVEK